MNQKQKIIILLSSLFCGSPIIFLSLRDNNQKNNLKVKKKEKENNQNVVSHEEHQESSSFLFWVVLTVIIVFSLVIIFGVIYKCQQKSKKNPKTEKKPDITKPQITGEKEDFQNNKQPKKEVNDPLAQKKSLKCCLNKYNKFEIWLIEDHEQYNKYTIKTNFLNEDIESNVPPEIKTFFTKFKTTYEKLFQNIMQEAIKFVTKYLTGDLLYDVYQDSQNNKTDYGILTEMANCLFDELNEGGVKVYEQSFILEKGQKESELPYDNIKTIMDTNDPIKLLKTFIREDDQAVFFIDPDNQKTPYHLFLHLFIFYQVIKKIYQNLLKFVQNRNDQKDVKYSENDISCIQDAMKTINDLIIGNKN